MDQKLMNNTLYLLGRKLIFLKAFSKVPNDQHDFALFTHKYDLRAKK